MERLYTYEFSIPNDPYFPQQDYVLVTTNPDEKDMEDFTDLFYTSNQGIYYYKDGFIIPQVVFDKVLKPLLSKSTSEHIIHDWEGGEN